MAFYLLIKNQKEQGTILSLTNLLIIFTLISTLFISCNTTFLNHKDFEFKIKDFIWNTQIEGKTGEIYLKDSNFIYGSNWDSSFIEISSNNGSFLDTINPYKVEKEKECLILDKSSQYYNGYSLHNVSFSNPQFSKVTLKALDRQFRGDDETYYLIISTPANLEFIILFSREQFSSIHDIAYFKEGKFIMTYNAESGYADHGYTTNFGLFDLEKIMNNE